jgi:hypothetical protein
MAEKLKITYATLSDSNEEIHKGYETGLAEARTLLGASYGNFVAGKWLTDGPTFEKRTPIDGSLLEPSPRAIATPQRVQLQRPRLRILPGRRGRGRSASS